MPNFLKSWPLYISCLVTLLLSAFSIYKRIEVESLNKASTISLEMETVRAAAAGEGVTVAQGLATLKEKGLGGVVLTEETVAELIGRGEVQLVPEPKIIASSAAADQVFAGLERRFPHLDKTQHSVGDKEEIDLVGEIRPSLEAIRGTSVGINPADCALARSQKLTIIGRLANPYGVTDRYVETTLKAAMQEGMTIFLPLGDQVLGRRDAIKPLLDLCKSGKLLYASPEFAKLGGDTEVIDKIPDHMVRLHSAQAAELDKLPMAEVIDRYARAARERGQRVLLLRPVSFASTSPLTDLGTLISDIGKQIRKEGGTIGVAHPFQDVSIPRWLFPVLGLSLIPVASATVAAFIPGAMGWAMAFFMVLGVGCYEPQARPIAALIAALVFPTAGFLALDQKPPKSILAGFALVSFVTMTGGAAVAGLLNGILYFVEAKQFEGVKAAIFLPVLAVGGYFFVRYLGLRSSLKQPATWFQLALGFGVLAALALLITRTGNDNPATVSGLELKMRAILDEVLFVRPRTKEFLVGHPMMIIGVAMFLRLRSGKQVPKGWAGWTVLALMGGAIGQTGMLNTMCHIHSPITLELLRNAVGWAVGGLIGIALWTVLSRMLLKPQQNLT